MRSWAGEFKQFLLRGNVVDLAVGIVIGAAFAAVVQALVRDFLTPLIAAIFGKPDFSRLSFTLHRPQHPQVPGVSQRDPPQGAAVRLLHLQRAGDSQH